MPNVRVQQERKSEMKKKLLIWDEVQRLTNVDRSTAWRQEEKGIFPARIIVGFNSVRWDEAEILKWLKLNKQGGTKGRPTCKDKKKTYRKKIKTAQSVKGKEASRSSKTVG